MGSCLDTDQRNDTQSEDIEYHQYGQYRASRAQAWAPDRNTDYIGRIPGGPGGLRAGGLGLDERMGGLSPDQARFPMHNGVNIKFEVPTAPVIFVLGGPGSGKVTHCDNLMQEQKGIVHINMTDLLQQYSLGNEMQDFAELSSQTVAEVLMLEMKMASSASTYLVSGYPRSMRDVVEYSNKIQVVQGVILISWRQKILERQVEYGARLGQVVLKLARMELEIFYRSVLPVAEFFDQRGMLIAVNGERVPNEVYEDFRAAVRQILTPATGNPAAESPSIPGDWPMAMPDPVKVDPAAVGAAGNAGLDRNSRLVSPTLPGYRTSGLTVPPIIWVIGGPGSGKSALCEKAVQLQPGWVHVSIGRLLRTTADGSSANAQQVRQNIKAGELVATPYVIRLVETQLGNLPKAQGVILDGFPRNMEQIVEFEQRVDQRPPIILLDCSKLQLGRGRMDDSVAAFRRRLDLFREMTLPMLRAMDQENRLTIVDGDTDTKEVQQDFFRAVTDQMDNIRDIQNGQPRSVAGDVTAQEAMLNDMQEDRPPQVRANGGVPRVSTIANGGVGLGYGGGPIGPPAPTTRNVDNAFGPNVTVVNGGVAYQAQSRQTQVPAQVYANPGTQRKVMMNNVEGYVNDGHI